MTATVWAFLIAGLQLGFAIGFLIGLGLSNAANGLRQQEKP